MSADDGIKLLQLNDGKWVAFHYMMSHDETTSEQVERVLAGGARFPRYESLEAVTQAYRGAAAETEYGFDIIHNESFAAETLGELKEMRQSPLSSAEVSDILAQEPSAEDAKNLAGLWPENATPPDDSSFGQELTKLINKHSIENQTGTPDFILARFIERQLWIFKETIEQRASHQGYYLDRFGTEVKERPKPPTPFETPETPL